jgi:hypothetical protein
MAKLQYSEPEPLSWEEMSERLRDLERDDRFDFMLLTLEPVDPTEVERRRRDLGPPAGSRDRRKNRAA